MSLGQGQEVVAEEAMGVAAEHGHWVILQNVHLVAKWLPTLEKKMEETFENPIEDYRFENFREYYNYFNLLICYMVLKNHVITTSVVIT